jgi:hypothetical protein
MFKVVDPDPTTGMILFLRALAEGRGAKAYDTGRLSPPRLGHDDMYTLMWGDSEIEYVRSLPVRDANKIFIECVDLYVSAWAT